MIPKIGKPGARTYGVLAYLYGPGRANEHTDPHLVASWDGFAPDPGRDPTATIAQLARALDLRVKQAGDRAPAKHVWHCSVRTAPTDRTLTDMEWAEVARRIVDATGIAPNDDPDGCRWIAVRHADDHIHIVATKVRGDVRPARNWHDYLHANNACAAIEAEWGLRQVDRGDRTPAKRPTRAETVKAERRGLEGPARQLLRDSVRQALAGAASEDEFFSRLTEAGLRVKQRIAPSGDITGYSVALPGDRDKGQQPIWFSGSTLAPDLSLPKIHVRLATSTEQQAIPSRPAHARRTASSAAEGALTILSGDSNDASAAAQLIGVGELLDALTQTTPTSTRTEVREAARVFERATRSHVHAELSDARALRSAARAIVLAGPALAKGEDGAAAAMILSSLVLLAITAAHWHAARGHAQQAAAARQAAQHLRAAYRSTAAHPLATMRAHGQRLPAPTRQRHATTLRAALPDHADRIQTEPGWPALTATLDQAEGAGHDAVALLRKVAAQRELDTADSLSEVLTWRLHHHAHLPPPAQPAPTGPRRTPRSTTPATPPTRTPPPPRHR